MSVVPQISYGIGSSPSLRDLPVELHRMIIAFMLEVVVQTVKDYREQDQRRTARTLLPLGSTSVYWHDVVLPYVYRRVDLDKSNSKLHTFVTTVVKKYGHHCRSLLIPLRLPRASLGDSEREETTFMDPDGEEPDILSVIWHARRSTLLSLAVPYMPNVEHLEIFTLACPWDHQFEDSDWTSCQCLLAYNSFLAALAADVFPLRSLDFDFGDTHFSRDWSDLIVSNILETYCDTLQVVKLMHEVWRNLRESKSFRLELSLPTLASLPNLRVLRLYNVCGCTLLGELDWEAPLEELSVSLARFTDPVLKESDDFLSDDERTKEGECDISAVFAALPSSVQVISWLNCATETPKMFSGPFPSHLTELQRCNFWYLSVPFINFLQSAPIRTLDVQELVGNDGNYRADHLFISLKNKRAFPNLDTIVLQSLRSYPRKKDWEQVCFERGITLLAESLPT